MKVLWFTNTPANADEYLNNELKGTGGWLKSLNIELQNKIDLHIAFYVDFLMKSFTYENTRFYPINKYNNKIEKYSRVVSGLNKDRSHLEKYLAIIKLVKPNIIHIHGTELPFIHILEHTNIPTVVSIQGNTTVISHKYYSGIEKKSGDIKLNNGFFRKLILPHKFSKASDRFIKQSAFERKYLMNCKYIIGRTAWDRRITRVLAPQSIYYHCDETLRDDFYTNKWEVNRSNGFCVFTTSDDNIYKGFETLCYALSLLNDLRQNIQWKVAGIKESDLIVKVVKKKLGNKYPTKNLILLGSLNAQEIVNELKKSSLYVMPSHIENSPNSLCEAMIMGMPCIATYAGGTGSLLVDGVEGVLIQDGDPWVMAGACIEMKNKISESILMGENARLKAMLRHDKKKIVSSLLEIYDSIRKDNFSNDWKCLK